ncbi:MAG: universal stress protein [Chloroflexi bacterium]|nr:universal stress protein [Chloroflexota bacterium]
MNTILMPTDGSEFSKRALPYALDLIEQTGARLVLAEAVSLLASSELIESEAMSHELIAEAQAELAAIAATIPPGRTVDGQVYTGDPASAICAAARANEADLIVMATHGRGGFGRWLYGSVADAIMRHAECPVLVIPLTCDAAWAPDQTRRILVALDGSELAEQALAAVLPLARASHGELLLLRAVTPGREDDQQSLATANAYLDGLRERLEHDGVEFRTLVQEGPPGSVIPAAARQLDVRMIAVATHGRGGVARQAMGSVTAELFHRATTPILVTRPH